MTITEFAESHNLQSQTVSRYISRHPELFEGHTQAKGKNVILDAAAIKLLEEKYPVPKPIEIVNGIPKEQHYAALLEKETEIKKLQAAIIDLQRELQESNKTLADVQSASLLLEMKNNQKESDLTAANNRISELNDELTKTKAESEESISHLESELSDIKNASLFKRIFKRY